MTDSNWAIYKNEHTVQTEDCDFLGHMNNIVYFKVFEDARWKMIQSRSFGMDTIQRLKQGPIILSIEVQFKKEIMKGVTVQIESRTLSYEGKVAVVEQVMKSSGLNPNSADATIHCVAQFKIGLFDFAQRKLILPTPEWLRACGFEAD